MGMDKDKVKGKVGKCKRDNSHRDEDDATKLNSEQLKKVNSSKSGSPSQIRANVLPTCHVLLTRCDQLTPLSRSFTETTEAKHYGNHGKNGDSIMGGRYKPAIATQVSMKCRLCSKSFGRIQHLKRPIKRHTCKRHHQCHLYSKSFGTPGHLKQHIRTHTGERPYECQLCSKSFAQQGQLNQHIRRHTGERPYQCDLCSKSFGILENLRIHVMLIHTSERPYQCNLCSKSFGTQGNLKKHTRTHTGERPYHCRICSKSFGESTNLKKHMRTHVTYNE